MARYYFAEYTLSLEALMDFETNKGETLATKISRLSEVFSRASEKVHLLWPDELDELPAIDRTAALTSLMV